MSEYGMAIGPGTITWSKVDSGAFYEYEPLQDITTYELAILTPYLSPQIFGPDASRKAAVVSALKSVPGSTCGATVLHLSEWDVESIGDAIRHFQKVVQT